MGYAVHECYRMAEFDSDADTLFSILSLWPSFSQVFVILSSTLFLVGYVVCFPEAGLGP